MIFTQRFGLFAGRSRFRIWIAAAMCVGGSPLALPAQGARENPASKMYVSDVRGDAVIDTGESIRDLSKRAVYNAQGSIIETKPASNDAERSENFSTMVYSNGTGAFFDADTRVEMKRFVQEPFTPTRTDMDVEPSISQTRAFLARGAVGLCTSRLVAGSSMVYQTPHAAVNIRGRKVVIEADYEVTKISMLEGASTVRAGPLDSGGHAIRAGEQAIIRRGSPGQPNSIQISRIPPGEAPSLDDKVAMACMAKRTVYFDVQEQAGAAAAPDTDETVSDAEAEAAGDSDAKASDPAAGANAGAVTAFYGNSAASPTVTREIVAVPVVPANLPVQFTISPATIITPRP